MSWEGIKRHALGDCLGCNGYSPASCVICQEWLRRLWLYSPTHQEGFDLVNEVEMHFIRSHKFNLDTSVNSDKDELYTWEDYEK